MASERPTRPRRVIHRGVVEASAIYVDTSIIGAARASVRVVAAWVPGATVHRVGSALLVRWPAPRWIACRDAPGLPLVRVGTRPGRAPLCSAPLDDDEIARIGALPGAALLVVGGVVETIEESASIEPASLLDVSAFAPLAVTSLGVPPPAPVIVTIPVSLALRGALGVGPAPLELAQILKTLAAGKPLDQKVIGAPRGRGAASPREAGAALSMIAGLFAGIAALLARFVGPTASSSGGAPRGSGDGAAAPASYRGLATTPQAPRGPSLLDQVRARLTHWIAAALQRARLAEMIGRRQSDYLDETMEMFERGDLTEALHRAVPLADDKAPGSLVVPSLTMPTPRGELQISLSRSALSSAMLTGGSFFDRLRATYRKAFERLEREGRIDEAAFVLAELLHADAEAVTFLERHGRLRLAAEIAEARGLPPGLVVRQWFLAGDTARAVRLARRFGVFADAVARLEHHALQPALRLLWADTLADAGDYAAAVDVIWPVAASRQLGAAWIEAALAQGGVAAARMLARKLELVPEAFAEVLARALALLQDGDEGAPAERIAFAEALLRAPGTPAHRTLARPTIRALVRDGARTAEPAVPPLVRKLIERADDASLRTDLPSWPVLTRPALRALAPAHEITLAASDTGPSSVHDFVELPNGRALIALGEGGVRVLGRDGRALFHLDQPAHRLVISDRGDRAIALARRGDVWRLARLDLGQRKSVAWGEIELDAFADTFDGSQWIVARRRELCVLDAVDAQISALHDLVIPGRAIAVGRTTNACNVVVKEDALTHWRFELPGLILRLRQPFNTGWTEGAIDVEIAGTSGAGIAFLEHSSPAGPTSARPWMQLIHGTERGTVVQKVDATDEIPLFIVMSEGFVAIVTSGAGNILIRLFDDIAFECRAKVTLAGARRASARFCGDTLAVSDDRGRLVTIELAHGGILRNQRV